MPKLLDRLFNYMGQLAENAGPSVTRWVYMRTSEAVTLGWLSLVAVTDYRYVRYGTVDAGLLAIINIIMIALFGFAVQTQNTKISVDSKNTNVDSTPLSSSVKESGS